MSRAMKDSGIPWIGEIPKNWNTPLLKGVFREREEKSTFGEETLLSLSQYTGIKPKSETEIADSHIASNYEGYKVVHKGDFVMNIMLAWNGSYAVSDYDGMISPAYCVYYFRDNSNKRYYHYLLRINGYQAAFKTLSRGIIDSRLRLYPEQFYTFPTLQPPLSEQQRIAEFLDRKCGEIDEAIALQEEFIEELKAYKQSVITEAVTRGLNPNVKLKDSGIVWISMIPQGWKCEKVKHIISSISSGVSVNSEQIPATDKELGVLKTSSVSSNYFIPTENKKVDVEEMGRVSCPVKADTIIVSRMNTPDLVGSAGYCDDNIPNLYLPDRLWQVETIKDRVSARYLWRFLISLSARYYYSSLSQGTSSSMQNISQSQFENAYVPVPPLTEQQQITDYLDNKCTEIDSLIAIKQQKIEELKDYKKSIIYEYVTGKKEVK